VDAETAVVDVVWRESRHGGSGIPLALTQSVEGYTFAEHLSARKTKAMSRPPPLQNQPTVAPTTENSILRRERFLFDDVFIGHAALNRLAYYTRQRTRKALESANNLVFTCLGCGDSVSEFAVEPPVGLLLGNGGGTGLISSCIDEIFRFCKPLTSNLNDNRTPYSGTFPSASPSSFVATRIAFEQLAVNVTLSAVIVADGGQIFDLLGSGISAKDEISSSSSGAVSGGPSLKRRKADGKVILCNAARVQLQATADFDRIMGLLLGKRAALQAVTQAMQHQQQRGGSSPRNDATMQAAVSAIDPWTSFISDTARRAKKTQSIAMAMDGFDAATGTSPMSSSTMLITVAVSGGGVSRRHTNLEFNFVSPCGANWSHPGSYCFLVFHLVVLCVVLFVSIC
jgi:hypothetical protein